MLDPSLATAPNRQAPPLPLPLRPAALPRSRVAVPLAHPWPGLPSLLQWLGGGEPAWRALVPLALLLAALMVRATAFLPSVINPDESLYAVQAQAWLRGGWPYLAVWDMHPVGAPGLVALAFALFGENLASLRLLGVLAVAGAGYALYLAVRVAGAGRLPGLATGLIYVASASLLDGLATNTEILLGPFLGAAMVLGFAAAARTLRLDQPPPLRWVMAAGLATGLALTIKPVVVPQGCLVFLLLVGPAWWRGLLPLHRLAMLALAYALCCATPMAMVATIYALRGDFGAFVDSNLTAPLRYVVMGVAGPQALRHVLAAAATLVVPLMLALAVLLPSSGRRRLSDKLLAHGALAWLAAAILAVALPGMYFQHYFLLVLPPVAVLAAQGARRLARVAKRGLVLASFCGLIGVTILQSWSTVLLPRLEHGIGLRKPDPPQRVASLLTEALAPGETIFVVNWQPLLYFLTGTEAPTRYVLPAQLTGRFAGVIGVDPDAEVARILAGQPRFLVLDSGRWGEVRPSARAMVTQALEAGYDLFAQMPGEAHSLIEIWRLK